MLPPISTSTNETRKPHTRLIPEQMSHIPNRISNTPFPHRNASLPACGRVATASCLPPPRLPTASRSCPSSTCGRRGGGGDGVTPDVSDDGSGGSRRRRFLPQLGGMRGGEGGGGGCPDSEKDEGGGLEGEGELAVGWNRRTRTSRPSSSSGKLRGTGVEGEDRTAAGEGGKGGKWLRGGSRSAALKKSPASSLRTMASWRAGRRGGGGYSMRRGRCEESRG